MNIYSGEKPLNITFVIDRFEGKYAILESQDRDPIIFDFPLHLLPKEAKEGSVLRFNIDIDNKEITKRRNKIIEELNRLKKNDQGGDIQL